MIQTILSLFVAYVALLHPRDPSVRSMERDAAVQLSKLFCVFTNLHHAWTNIFCLWDASTPRLQNIKWFPNRSKLFPQQQSCVVSMAEITGKPSQSITAVTIWLCSNHLCWKNKTSDINVIHPNSENSQNWGAAAAFNTGKLYQKWRWIFWK